MKTENTDIIMQNKIFIRIALVTGLILLIPLIAMQFTNDVNWSLSDFVIMGVLLLGAGSLFVLTARKVDKGYRLIVAVIFLAVLFYLWVELAVGIFTNWGS